MKLIHLGTQYGGWTIDIDRVPETGYVIDAGVGTDMSFAEALHELRPGLMFVMIDHTDEARDFVTKTRGHKWAKFIQAAVAPLGSATVKMFRHKTSGSESFSEGHSFINPQNSYEVPAISLSSLIGFYKPCIVKLDIESAEYGTIRECIGVPQVCCEFHHRMDSRYTRADTDQVVIDFKNAGYEVADWTPTDEILMVKK